MTKDQIVDLLDRVNKMRTADVQLKASKTEWLKLLQLALMGCDLTQPDTVEVIT